jgi:hypothetical protein
LAYQASLEPLTARNVVGIVFYACCFTNAVLLFRISTKWKLLMVKWMKTEEIFCREVYRETLPKAMWSLRKRIFIMTAVYMLLAFTEHGLWIASEINQFTVEVKTCNVTDRDFVELYIKKHLKFVFINLPFKYNHFLGFFAEYLNFTFTCYWSFINLFIILISLGCAILFEKINLRVKTLKRLLVGDSMWSEIRCHHVQVSELIKIVNENINEIIIAASFSDGYFILSQAINITT